MEQMTQKEIMKEIIKLIVRIVKMVVADLAVFGMAYVFTFYLDADIGVVILAFLFITPILSHFLARTASKKISADLEAPTYIAKGKRFAAKTTLSAAGKLPIPFVQCHLESSGNFIREDARPVQGAMMPGKPLEITFSMTAAYAGCGTLLLNAPAVHDYLGDIMCPVKKPAKQIKVGVIPEIPSLTGAAVMLRSVSDVVMTQDEEEEETSASFSAVSMPGYIHRDYVPGDNLRRINWKLSAKRNRLMVRMDEAASTVRPSLMLDLQAAGTSAAYKMRETLMEGALGFLMLMVRQGIPCSVRFASEGSWKCFLLENEDAVRTAAVELATADFAHDGSRLDRSALMEKAGAFLIYTTNPDAELQQTLAEFHDHGHLCCVVPEALQVLSVPHTDAVWMLSEDYTMTALQK